MQVNSTAGAPVGKRHGGLKGMTGPAYVQRSRLLLGRIQELQRELRHQTRKGGRDEQPDRRSADRR